MVALTSQVLNTDKKQGNGAFGAWIPIPNSASDEVNAASYTVTNVNNPSESTFEVRAFNALGVGEVSHEASAIEPPTPVCDRTPQVRDAIVNTIITNEIPDVSICDDVTPAHLVTINGLFLGYARYFSTETRRFFRIEHPRTPQFTRQPTQQFTGGYL